MPLFLFLAWTEAHGPYDAPPSAFLDESNASRHLSSEVRNYRGMISCCDAGTANISAALKRKGMWDATLMLWASDNGAVTQGGEATGSNHPFRGGKGQMFEGGVRTVAFLAGGAVPHGAPRRSSAGGGRRRARPPAVKEWERPRGSGGGSGRGKPPAFGRWKRPRRAAGQSLRHGPAAAWPSWRT